MSGLSDHLSHQATQNFQEFFWHRLRHEAVCKEFSQVPESILDIGAGAGHFGMFLRRRYPETQYQFVEPLVEMRTSLCERFGSDNDRSDATSYDRCQLIVMLDVLEHIEDDLRFLQTVFERAPHGARLIITVPALMCLWSRWDEVLGHFRRYNKAGLVDVVQRSGFTVRKSAYLFPELVPLALYRTHISAAEKLDSGEFPELGMLTNELLYQVGKCSRSLTGRFAPFGSSLLLSADKVSPNR